MKLENKVAVVSGAARGIGRACALHLASLGADVVIVDIRLDAAKEFEEKLTAETVMDEVKALGRRCIGIETDVTDKRAVNAMFKKILDEFGHIDILVNVVGGNQASKGPLRGDSMNVSEEDFRFVLDRNLMSTVFCCQAAIPAMIAQKSGSIVNISSRAGIVVSYGKESIGYAAQSAYGSAKAGVIQYTRVLAGELGPHGIRVNCITPGLIATGRVAAFIKKGSISLQNVLDETPLKKMGQPEDIAKVVEFLCTDMSDFVTGQCIRVDGGRSLF